MALRKLGSPEGFNLSILRVHDPSFSFLGASRHPRDTKQGDTVPVRCWIEFGPNEHDV